MKKDNMISIREFLEQLPTEQLDGMLKTELEKQPPDAQNVRLILSILKQRDAALQPTITPGVQSAWERYEREEVNIPKPRRTRNALLRAASIVLVIGLALLAIPREATAQVFFSKLFRWTDSILEFFAPETVNENQLVYEFKTDNPDLQQVYDAVVKIGITEPVVPTWLPEGYELVECVENITSQKEGLRAVFANEGEHVILQFDMYELDVSHRYYKDESEFIEYETNGIFHTCMRNDNRWSVIWINRSAECFLTIDCQEDTLYQILDSIYVTEGTNETLS